MQGRHLCWFCFSCSMLLETLSTSPKICLHLCLESFSYVMSGSQALRNQTLTMLVAGRVKPVKEKTAIHDEPTHVRVVRSASYGIGLPSVVSPQSFACCRRGSPQKLVSSKAACSLGRGESYVPFISRARSQCKLFFFGVWGALVC